MTVIATRTRDTRPINMKKAFKKLNEEMDDLDDEEKDELQDLEEKIK